MIASRSTRGMMRRLRYALSPAMDSPRPLKIPVKMVLIDIVGALLCGVGVYSLMASDGTARMHAAVAALLMVSGIVLMGYAMLRILLRIRAASRDPKS